MEPERRIEKLLRSFAKKRREQAGEPMELRPEGRARLHREISRRAAENTGNNFFSTLLSALRPRLAFTVCFVALACLIGWLLMPALNHPKPSTLAAANPQRANSPKS